MKRRAGMAGGIPLLLPAPPGFVNEIDLTELPQEEATKRLAEISAARRSALQDERIEPGTLHPIAQRAQSALSADTGRGDASPIEINVAHHLVGRGVHLISAVLCGIEKKGHKLIRQDGRILLEVFQERFSLVIYEPETPTKERGVWTSVKTGRLAFKFIETSPGPAWVKRHVGPWWDREIRRVGSYVAVAIDQLEARAQEIGQRRLREKERQTANDQYICDERRARTRREYVQKLIDRHERKISAERYLERIEAFASAADVPRAFQRVIGATRLFIQEIETSLSVSNITSEARILGLDDE